VEHGARRRDGWGDGLLFNRCVLDQGQGDGLILASANWYFVDYLWLTLRNKAAFKVRIRVEGCEQYNEG